MREVKFRAWDAEVCRMFPSYGVIGSMTFDQNNECTHLGIYEYDRLTQREMVTGCNMKAQILHLCNTQA